eukprot:sb/3477582/
MLGLPSDALPNAFIVLTYFLLYINSWANAFIYYWTNPSFARYVRCLLLCRPYGARVSTATAAMPNVGRLERISVVNGCRVSVVNNSGVVTSGRASVVNSRAYNNTAT